MSEPNPFSAPRGLPQQQPQASPQAPPQVKTLGMLVGEWMAAPGAALGAAHPAAACTPSPPPLRLVAFCSSAPPPPLPPPPAAAAAAAAEPPPLCDALLLARQQQWQRLLGCVPAAQQLLPAGAALTPGALALARCRLGALAATRRWLCAVEESSHVLQALARHCSSSSSGGDSGDAAAASAVWLCLHAEALRACSLWREAFYVAHGVVRALQLPAPAAGSSGGGSSSWVAPLDAGPAAGAGQAAAAAAAPEAAAVAATAAAVEGALAALASGSAAIAPRAAARLVILAGSVCAAALTGPAFYLGAANAASDAAAAVASRLRSPPAPAPAPTPAPAPSPPLLLQLAAEDGGLHWALEAPPEWVSQGLALLGCVRTHRTIGREEEAKAALGALFALPQWRAAGDLLIAVTQGGSVGSAELAALSPPTAYALGVLGCIRGGEALALARPGEALPLYEAAIVALASRFLPAAGGGGGGGQAAAAAASASLLGASSCLASSAGGQTLLPVRPGGGGGGGGGGASGSAPSAAAPGAGGGGAPQGFLADPCDLLVDAAIGAAEAVRRLPPPALSSTSVQQPPPPIVLSMTLLEALVRSCPAVCLRAALASALTGLYDAGRDAMAAAAGKRLLAALAHAYGLGHLDRADFRIVA